MSSCNAFLSDLSAQLLYSCSSYHSNSPLICKFRVFNKELAQLRSCNTFLSDPGAQLLHSRSSCHNNSPLLCRFWVFSKELSAQLRSCNAFLSDLAAQLLHSRSSCHNSSPLICTTTCKSVLGYSSNIPFGHVMAAGVFVQIRMFDGISGCLRVSVWEREKTSVESLSLESNYQLPRLMTNEWGKQLPANTTDILVETYQCPWKRKSKEKHGRERHNFL